MAAVRTVVRVCDNCDSGEDVQPRQIRLPADGNRQLTFEACAECLASVPMRRWESMFPSRRTGGRGHKTPLVFNQRRVDAMAGRS